MARVRMMFLAATVALMVVALVAAGPTSDSDRAPKLSDQEHYRRDHAHNSDYDHEAFLGKEEAKHFSELPPHEAKRRLGIIISRVDRNSDGVITRDELREWIEKVAHRYIWDDTDRQWGYHEMDNDGFVTWEEYSDEYFGPVEDLDEIHDKNRGLTYRQIKDMKEKKFRGADKNRDKKLSKEEFGYFLHPEGAMYMRDVYIDETMQNIDRNRDGYIDIHEYLKELWPDSMRDKDPTEPEWLAREKEYFRKHRDRDSDGRLSKREVADWIMPEDYDYAAAEADHLIYEADSNKDKRLTREEILSSQELFVGSAATEHGEFLVRHDEF